MRGVIPHRPRPLALGLLVALAMAPAVALAADPDTYSAAPIHGWVVDAETKQPLEGVHVVAQWILQTGLLHGEHSTRLHIMETVTDQSGAYHFPGWGPKPRPFLARFDGFDPMLTFFKPGHVPLDRTNFDPPQEGALRTSVWDGKTIELQPFRAPHGSGFAISATCRVVSPGARSLGSRRIGSMTTGRTSPERSWLS